MYDLLQFGHDTPEYFTTITHKGQGSTYTGHALCDPSKRNDSFSPSRHQAMNSRIVHLTVRGIQTMTRPPIFMHLCFVRTLIANENL